MHPLWSAATSECHLLLNYRGGFESLSSAIFFMLYLKQLQFAHRHVAEILLSELYAGGS